MIKICAACGKQFATNYRNKKCCSAVCSDKWTKITRRARYFKKLQKEPPKEMRSPATPKPKLFNVSCLACGKSFEQHFPAEKFCSDNCRLDFFSLTAVENLFDFIRG